MRCSTLASVGGSGGAAGTPGLVPLQVGGHALAHVDREFAHGQDLLAEVQEPDVMPDVRVREEHAVQRKAPRADREEEITEQVVELLGQLWSCIDEEAAVGLAVDET